MSFSSDEVNYLIYRYLKESGFQHTAFTFGYESNIVRADVNPSEVSHGALINIVQKGLLYLDIEREVKGLPKDNNEPTVLVRSLNKALTNSGAVTTTNSNTGAAPTRTKKEPLSSSSGATKSATGTPAKSTSVTSTKPTATSQLLSNTAHDTSSRTPTFAAPGPVVSSSTAHPLVPPIALPRPSSPAMDVDIMGLSPSRQNIDDIPPVSISPPPTSALSSIPSSAPSKAIAKVKEEHKETKKEKAAKAAKASAAAAAASSSTAVHSSPSNSGSAGATGASGTSASTATSSVTPTDRLLLKGHSAEVVTCSWNPRNPELIATGSADSTVRLWTLQGISRSASTALHHGAKVKPGMTPPSQVTVVSWNGQGSCLATACFDGTVRLWDAGFGVPKTQLNTKFLAHTGAVFALRWAPNGLHVASGGADKALALWNTPLSQNGTSVAAPATAAHKFADLHTDSILDIDFSSDSQLLASSSVDKIVKIVSLESSSHDLASLAPLSCLGHSAAVNSIRWASLQSKDLLASASDDHDIRIWDTTQPAPILSSVSTLSGHSKEAFVVRWNPSHANQLASGSFDATARVWDATRQVSLFSLEHTDAVVTLDYATDGNLLASGSHDKSVCVWDSRTGELARQVTCGGRVLEVSLNVDGSRLAACCSDNTATIFELRM